MALEQDNKNNDIPFVKFPTVEGYKLPDSVREKYNETINSMSKVNNSLFYDYDGIAETVAGFVPTFYDYAISLMGKYQANDYHRMMTTDEIYTFIDLYTKEFKTNREQALKTFEDTVNQQLSYQRNENEIKQQGLAQEKLMSMSSDYTSKYGKNFIVYLNDEELEKYSIQYLHSYNVRRSDISKMYV